MHGARSPGGRPRHDDADGPSDERESGERVGVIEKIDFLVRFWELEARNATLGQPLSSAEQVELLSLMQLVTGDRKMPPAGPVVRTRSALPAQVIGDGTMKAVEIRSVSASAILVAGPSAMSVGAQVIVRAADAVSGVEYALPCRVVWVYTATPCTMALVVDGVPTRTDFATPPTTHAHGALSMGRTFRLVG
jgi:hypothetical protein